MLNDRHSVQRKKLRRLQALQLKALRLVQKDARLGGDLGGLEPDDAVHLQTMLKQIQEIAASGKSWLKILGVQPKEKA